ncbi:hypothetical protein GE061_008961 [Apolygus lucorum]|uniref:Uncharacterized protein n=1 Tax=Apolygus lucorum TaxID=248454 RepID=A0A8S9XYU4_APOLU|nr:hypothetical protein GE061_008961 [Apolygus lucorum]
MVQAALPAIDNAPPPFREHVSYKLKKIQKESERCTQIISDNFTLLQHLSVIMKTTRIDHFWDEPPPKFLQRVGIYTSKDTTDVESVKNEETELPPPTSRRDKCHACSPNRYKVEMTYDVRRPFTPPKERMSKKPESLPDWENQFKSRCDEDRLEFRGKVWKKPRDEKGRKKSKTCPSVKKKSKTVEDDAYNSLIEEENQSIVLTRKGLSVAVMFPAHTGVVFTSSSQTKVIQKNFCECKSFPRIRRKKNSARRSLKDSKDVGSASE